MKNWLADFVKIILMMNPSQHYSLFTIILQKICCSMLKEILSQNYIQSFLLPLNYFNIYTFQNNKFYTFKPMKLHYVVQNSTLEPIIKNLAPTNIPNNKHKEISSDSNDGEPTEKYFPATRPNHDHPELELVSTVPSVTVRDKLTLFHPSNAPNDSQQV